MDLSQYKRIVIKVGSSLIFGADGKERRDWLKTLAQDIDRLRGNGSEVIVVSSGAVAFGRLVMNYGMRMLSLEEKQAAAACGQTSLMSLWAEYLQQPGVYLYPAQILLTGDDSMNRRRYLNVRNTLDTLLENKQVIPVINENDTVTTAEIRFGDNDRLSARVAQMAGADLLILLSDIDGLYTADPRKNENATFIEVVQTITSDIEAMAGGAGSDVGSGGMITKIAAAKIATAAGCSMIIAKGEKPHPIRDMEKHTRFVANGNPLSARKNWIAGDMHPAGKVMVDDGAVRALANGKSLLPAGVTSVSGDFERGDTVAICDASGKVLGKGIIAYDAADASVIIGKNSSEFESLLGFRGRDVLIHRDDMVLD